MANSFRQNDSIYISDEDDGDELFDGYDYETIPTQPLHRPTQPASLINNRRHVTPPTQSSRAASRQTATSSPPPSDVQVVASSPVQPTARSLSTGGPTTAPVQRGSLNGGILAHSMAPPGTQFRPPFQPKQSSFDRDSRSQTIDLQFSDDDRVEDSSDDDQKRPPPMKPSVFTRHGKPVDAMGNPLRVESPPALTFDKFRYNSPPGPQKRSADVMANAYAFSRKPKALRQTEPAAARPIDEPDISLDEIHDYYVREKIKMMRDALGASVSVRQCESALRKKHYNYSDAIEYLTDEVAREERYEQHERRKLLEQTRGDSVDLTQLSDGDELDIKSPAHLVPRQGVKRDVKNVKSITEKWSTAQNRNPLAPAAKPSIDRPVTPPLKKPKRKLIRPPVAESPVQPSSSPAAPSKPQGLLHAKENKAQRSSASNHVTIDSDVDEGIELPSDEEDSGASSIETLHESASEAKLLNFLNDCTSDDVREISNLPRDDINKVLAKRPFESLEAVRRICTESTSLTKTGKTRISKKEIGDRLVNTCLDMWKGYEAVDHLVAECEELGKPVRNEMERFGFLDSAQGELQVVDLESGDRDSGIGTPVTSSTTTSVDEDFDAKTVQAQKKTSAKKNERLLSQPAMMSSSCTLKDYQVTGLNWLALLFSNNMSGILADDMGLGKTIQVIAFLAHLTEIGVTGPHLVIVPGSTLENWLREFRNFCPELKVEPYYGSQSERAELQEQLLSELESGDVSIIVTTYDMAVSPSDAKFLRKTQPKVCVYDEGHTLKNSRTKRYYQLMRIPAQFRLLLTGTPLQNNLQELMALLGFIMPDVFEKHREELKVIFQHKAKTSSNDETARAAFLSAQRVSRARSMIKPFILRRKKEQVLKHLPRKTCRVEYCQLSEAQESIYRTQAHKVKETLMAPSTLQGTVKAKANVLMELRKAAIHPLLFRQRYDDKTLRKMSTACLKEPEFCQSDAELVWQDFSVMTDFEIDRFCYRYPSTMSDFALPSSPAPCLDSGKVSKLVELLKDHAHNHARTLVFSQFTMVMDILEQVFETEGISFSRLDGSTKMQERQDLIDQFTVDESISVFMLSTKAGGAGINLASANKVIIFDSSFNPQDDIQAENRAHRVGQQREVEVVRLITKDTIEEQIYALGETKLALDKRVAGDGASEKAAEAAEEEGIDLVASMMQERMHEAITDKQAVKQKPERTVEMPDRTDLKDAYLKSLKEAGINVNTE